MSIQLYVPFLARELETTPDRVRPERADAAEVQKLLWPVAGFFQTVAGIADYRDEAEAEADALMEALEANPAEWPDFSSDAARVLLERTKYALTILECNAQAGETVICPPLALGDDLRRVAAALLWLHRAELPAEWRERLRS